MKTKTTEELMDRLRVVEMWTPEKGDAVLELLGRDDVDMKALALAVRAGTPDYCPHGRPMVKSCIACDGEPVYEEEDVT